MPINKKAAKKIKSKAKVFNKARRKKEDSTLSFENQLKIEREKYLALWAAIIFFMAVIVSFWLFSFKNSIAVNVAKQSNNGVFSDVLNNFNQTFDNTSQNLAEISNAITRQNSQSQADQEKIEALQNRLAEIESRIELEKFLAKFNSEIKQEVSINE
ncbi:hypothetical protein COT95_01190 [Candidatus Falkowbacteria bacterium CG10_big_fil_rev_8_21_14_0_10_37_6]|uniref:Uncharacterized protein n=1 Tax=Candidatus Falkowbacteria bacterium CG10_big_fil_rev_8_21_14_0_10_37_6 TaxID=1974563 RepID=A0A2H0V7D3_9BACT|nr:MAG: hypothetical protein COT95_01190 [Candidatus Falkowbacteria bacterium CG10_big_fil_rev_8_21_14_0_10_37_6]